MCIQGGVLQFRYGGGVRTLFRRAMVVMRVVGMVFSTSETAPGRSGEETRRCESGAEGEHCAGRCFELS